MRAGLVILSLAALAACGGSAGPEQPAEPLNETESRGQLLSLACQACHSLNPGEDHLIGPNLYGMFGRRAGSLSDFEYSGALQSLDLIWSVEALDAWLADPFGFAPGTTMTFTGYQSADDRAALLAYLLVATGATAEDTAQ